MHWNGIGKYANNQKMYEKEKIYTKKRKENETNYEVIYWILTISIITLMI